MAKRGSRCARRDRGQVPRYLAHKRATLRNTRFRQVSVVWHQRAGTRSAGEFQCGLRHANPHGVRMMGLCYIIGYPCWSDLGHSALHSAHKARLALQLAIIRQPNLETDSTCSTASIIEPGDVMPDSTWLLVPSDAFWAEPGQAPIEHDNGARDA